jgi:hypothetical protein
VNATKFLTELKRRNVYRAAVAYGVVASTILAKKNKTPISLWTSRMKGTKRGHRRGMTVRFCVQIGASVLGDRAFVLSPVWHLTRHDLRETLVGAFLGLLGGLVTAW